GFMPARRKAGGSCGSPGRVSATGWCWRGRRPPNGTRSRPTGRGRRWATLAGGGGGEGGSGGVGGRSWGGVGSPGITRKGAASTESVDDLCTRILAGRGLGHRGGGPQGYPVHSPERQPGHRPRGDPQGSGSQADAGTVQGPDRVYLSGEPGALEFP